MDYSLPTKTAGLVGATIHVGLCTPVTIIVPVRWQMTKEQALIKSPNPGWTFGAVVDMSLPVP